MRYGVCLMQHFTPCRGTFKGIACCSDACSVKQGWLVSKDGDPSPSLDNVSPCCIPPVATLLSLYQASVSHCSVWLMPLPACLPLCASGKSLAPSPQPSSCKQQADLPEFPPGLTKSPLLTVCWNCFHSEASVLLFLARDLQICLSLFSHQGW